MLSRQESNWYLLFLEVLRLFICFYDVVTSLHDDVMTLHCHSLFGAKSKVWREKRLITIPCYICIQQVKMRNNPVHVYFVNNDLRKIIKIHSSTPQTLILFPHSHSIFESNIFFFFKKIKIFFFFFF